MIVSHSLLRIQTIKAQRESQAKSNLSFFIRCIRKKKKICYALSSNYGEKQNRASYFRVFVSRPINFCVYVRFAFSSGNFDPNPFCPTLESGAKEEEDKEKSFFVILFNRFVRRFYF